MSSDRVRGPMQRCVPLSDAAAYCGLSESGFLDWVRREIVPGPINGTQRYDLRAIDAALDRLSGLEGVDKMSAAEMSAYEAWQAARKRGTATCASS